MFKFDIDTSLGFDVSIITAVILWVYNKEGEKEVYLFDEKRRKYALEDCAILADGYSSENMDVKFPKPFEIESDGTLISQGDRLLVVFPENQQTPIILGSLNFLGLQRLVNSPFQINEFNNANEIKYRESGESKQTERKNDKGQSYFIENASYKIRVINGNAILSSSNHTTVEGEQSVDVLGKTVEIGGNTQRNDDVEKNIENKAEVINLYGKRVVLGHSNTRGEEFEIDSEERYLTPKLQQGILGNTLKKLQEIQITLIETLIDSLCEALYMGGGAIVQMSVQDQTNIKTNVKAKLIADVKEKLPIMLSDVVVLLSKPELVKEED